MQAGDILQRAVGMALGTAIGDAKGIAFETLTREQILEKQKSNEPGLYARVVNNPYVPENWQIGRWTDDTQLSLAMMRAISKHLQNNDDFMSNVVREHIAEWKESVGGWGGTKNAIERLANNTHKYVDSGNQARGNGVLMKLAPLALYYSLCGNMDEQEIEAICRMTHNTPVALATACVYVHICMYLFETITHDWKSFLQYVYQLCLTYEAKYGLTEDRDLTSKRLKRYLDASDCSEIDEKLIIDVSRGGTFDCVDSLTMIIGLLACLPTCEPTFDTLVRATEIGGDTDSNAAMIGALLGGMKGVDCLEQEHIKQVYRSDDVRQVGEEFGRAIAKHLQLDQH